MICVLLPLTAHAQFGNLMNNLKNNPALKTQVGVQDIISKAQNIASVFAQMPLNNGKLEFIKAALPMLTQALTASKDATATGTGKVSGVLDQVKGLFTQKWDTAAITADQMPKANAQVQQFSGMLSDIVKNEGGALKAMLVQTAAK